MDGTKQKHRAKFIVFEGIDGAGKTTQIKYLQAALSNMGIPVSVSAEPTGSMTGTAIRKALSGEISRTQEQLAELFALDRIKHNTDKSSGIIKTLSDGVSVISDRYYYSSMAYQGAEIGIDKVISLNLNNPKITRPDICIFLDLTPEQSMERILRAREKREIFETHEILKRTRDMFMTVFEHMSKLGDNIVKIDASRNVEEVSDDILSTVLIMFQ